MKQLSILAAAVALVLAGCGGSDDKADKTTSTATSSGAGASGDTVAVSMKNIQFMPNKISVKVGQTVKWTNDDPVAHNVTSDTFKSGTINGGQTYEYKPTKPGVYKYECTIHSGQTGELDVTG